MVITKNIDNLITTLFFKKLICPIIMKNFNNQTKADMYLLNVFLGCSYSFNRSKTNANNFITAYEYSLLVRFALHNQGYLEP
jgi:hypothetical protein